MFERWVGTYDVPIEFESLCALAALSSAYVVECVDAPPDFHGVQMEQILYVNTSGALSPLKLLRWKHTKNGVGVGSACVCGQCDVGLAWTFARL